MWVYLYPNNTETELKNAYIGEYHTQIFDFQNDGNLGRTTATLFWTPSYVANQWWTIWSTSWDSQSYIIPPASVYNGGTLKRIKIWMYKGIVSSYASWFAHGVWAGILKSWWWDLGIYWSQAWANINYDRIHANNTFIQTASITWEVEFELDFTWTNVACTINWNTYNTSVLSSDFDALWKNNQLVVTVANWRAQNTDIYVRKVQIETTY